jgi:hypothetical protein
MVKTTKTRKISKSQKQPKTMTIPQLRGAFERLDKLAAQLKGKAKGEQVSEFQKEWRAIFSKPVGTKAVEAYLAVKQGRGKRPTRKQRGGAAPLAGAPIDFQTRPGLDGGSGTYLTYVDSGLSFYDKINQPAIQQGCGIQNITPQIPHGMGSNQAGGAPITDFASALTFKPIVSTSPPSVFQDIRSAYLGTPLPASPAVEDHTWKYK